MPASLEACHLVHADIEQVQADQIKIYLAATLGDAPKPDWGLKLGWGQYLAGVWISSVWFLCVVPV